MRESNNPLLGDPRPQILRVGWFPGALGGLTEAREGRIAIGSAGLGAGKLHWAWSMYQVRPTELRKSIFSIGSLSTYGPVSPKTPLFGLTGH